MPNKSRAVLVMSLGLGAGALGAQETATCTGPGAAFGVTSYRCASCGVKQTPGARPQFIFEAEPVVLETTPGSSLSPGDVIVAVNGTPIMAQAGSDAFTYPSAGKSVVTVRRGNARVDVEATSLACRAQPPAQVETPAANEPLVVVDGVIVPSLKGIPQSDIESVEVLKGAAAAAVYGSSAGRGVVVVTTKAGKAAGANPSRAPSAPRPNEPLIIVDGVVQSNSGLPPLAPPRTTSGQFGFALECPATCGRSALFMGTETFRFETFPRVVELWPGGPADRAGMRVGDLVTHIDGKSILGKEGTKLITGDGRTTAVRVTVKRDGSEVSFTLKAR